MRSHCVLRCAVLCVAEQVIMEATSAVNPDFVVTFQEPFALHTQEYVSVQPLVWHVV